MATSGQLSLLSRGPLFDPQVLRQYLKDHEADPVPSEEHKRRAITEWMRTLPVGAKETRQGVSFARVLVPAEQLAS